MDSLKKRIDDFIAKGAWNREQEQVLDYGAKPPKMPKRPKAPKIKPVITEPRHPKF
jgi:sulfur transfer protein SufE